jgi:hypothetical protein
LLCEPLRLELVHSPMEKRSLRPCQAPEPPRSIDDVVHEKLLDRPHRREVCSNLVPKILKGVRVLSWENHITGTEPMPERVETGGGFSLWRLWPWSGARLIGWRPFVVRSSRLLPSTVSEIREMYTYAIGIHGHSPLSDLMGGPASFRNLINYGIISAQYP